MATENYSRVRDNVSKMLQMGAPDMDVQAYLKSEGYTPERFIDARGKELEAGPITTSPGPGRAFAQGATLGTADEIEAALRAQQPDVTYDQALASIRLANQEYQRTNPARSTTAELAGAIVPVAAATALSRGAATGPALEAAVGPTVARAAMLGALEGGVAGFASGEGGFDARREASMIPMALGLATGPLALLGGRALGTVGQTTAAAAAPFTQAGREALVGRILRRYATDPLEAQRRLAAAGPERALRGSLPTTAQSARDPGLAALETPVRQAVAEGNPFAVRQSEQAAARFSELNRIGGNEGKLARATAKREAVTAPMREAAFAAGQPMEGQRLLDVLDTAIANPENQQEVVEKALRHFRDRVAGKIDPNTGTLDPRIVYGITKDMGLAMSGKLAGDQSNFRYARQALTNVKRDLEGEIEQAAPGFRDYMTEFAQRSRPIDQMRLLQKIRDSSTLAAPDVSTGLPVLSQAKMRGALMTYSDRLGQLSPAQRNRVQTIMRDLDRSTAAVAPGVQAPGSNTFRNLSVANVIGQMVGEGPVENAAVATLARPLNWMYQIPEEGVKSLLAEAMLDPQLAARLLDRANKGVKPSTARQLARKAHDMGLLSLGNYLGVATGLGEDNP